MKLAVLKGFQNKSDVTISSVPYDIGRCRSADFVIAHVNVSRNHCKIIKENKLWKISDFSSSGTYVNDALVGKGKTVIINDGDSIRFGPVENNLCWTFHSFDSACENYFTSNASPRTQVVLSLYNEKCLEETNVPRKITDVTLEGTNKNEVCKNYESIGEAGLKEHQQKIDNNNLKVIKESQNVKECNNLAKEETVRSKSESKKIEELTKELQEVQTALNVLEKQNCALQVELAAGATSKTEITETTNVLENLADLMEAEFQCTICSELFVTAVTLSCTHTFCKYCIGQWKKKQKTCPICRKKITNETRSLVVDNYIDKVVGNLSAELKERREAIIKERNETEPCKKRAKKKHF